MLLTEWALLYLPVQPARSCGRSVHFFLQNSTLNFHFIISSSFQCNYQPKTHYQAEPFQQAVHEYTWVTSVIGLDKDPTSCVCPWNAGRECSQSPFVQWVEFCFQERVSSSLRKLILIPASSTEVAFFCSPYVQVVFLSFIKFTWIPVTVVVEDEILMLG